MPHGGYLLNMTASHPMTVDPLIAQGCLTPTRPTFLPGEVIDDTWEVEAQLGKGGMGSVYRCRHLGDGRRAAIKLLAKERAFDAHARARFRREAEILASLNHPNVVRVHSVELDAHPPHLEMELVEGFTLGALLHNQGALDPAVALFYLRQLVDASTHLHAQGIFHRDLKPDNILVTPDGGLKVVDFGLAVATRGPRLTHRDSTHFGTVAYCPPEWMEPGRLDGQVWDLYSLGVVAWEMLTGEQAFATEACDDVRSLQLATMELKATTPFLDPGGACPDALRELVRSLTARDRRQRPRSAAALSTLLARVEHPGAGTPLAASAPGRTGLLLAGLAVSVGALALAAGCGVLALGLGLAL